MSESVEGRLHAFAADLLERRGALVDWPADAADGVAVLPPEVAATLGAPEEVTLANHSVSRGLGVQLAGDFLEWSGTLLQAVPPVAAVRLTETYLKRKDLAEAVQRRFTWTNAKVTIKDTRATAGQYHACWYHATFTSDDRWETCFRFTINTATGIEVDLPDPLDLWDIAVDKAAVPPALHSRCAELARRRALGLAREFLDRMDARLERDRKRLRDYYRALARESDRRPRGHQPPDPEKAAAKRRAVELELQRKMGELEDRYTIQAAVEPFALVRMEVPVLAVDLTVQRKQARAPYTAFWNPLLKQFEPLPCSQCGEGAYVVTFANETVAASCPKCAARP